jgi:hypothetical protein
MRVFHNTTGLSKITGSRMKPPIGILATHMQIAIKPPIGILATHMQIAIKPPIG